MKDGHVTIVAPFDGSPAQHANLHPGDFILKVDGQDVTGLPLEEVVTRILGHAGTSVMLTILDPTTGDVRNVTLQRAHITLHNVTWQQIAGISIAHVRVEGFSQDVGKGLQRALNDIQRQTLKGIILDLRNNPGGLLNEAVGAASQFLSGGNVVQDKDAQRATLAGETTVGTGTVLNQFSLSDGSAL